MEPTNVYGLAAIVILALTGGLGGWVLNKRNGKRSNGSLTEDRVRWLIAEHQAECPRINELRSEIREMRDEMRSELRALREDLRDMWRQRS